MKKKIPENKINLRNQVTIKLTTIFLKVKLVSDTGIVLARNRSRLSSSILDENQKIMLGLAKCKPKPCMKYMH